MTHKHRTKMFHASLPGLLHAPTFSCHVVTVTTESAVVELELQLGQSYIQIPCGNIGDPCTEHTAKAVSARLVGTELRSLGIFYHAPPTAARVRTLSGKARWGEIALGLYDEVIRACCPVGGTIRISDCHQFTPHWADRSFPGFVTLTLLRGIGYYEGYGYGLEQYPVLDNLLRAVNTTTVEDLVKCTEEKLMVDLLENVRECLETLRVWGAPEVTVTAEEIHANLAGIDQPGALSEYCDYAYARLVSIQDMIPQWRGVSACIFYHSAQRVRDCWADHQRTVQLLGHGIHASEPRSRHLHIWHDTVARAVQKMFSAKNEQVARTLITMVKHLYAMPDETKRRSIRLNADGVLVTDMLCIRGTESRYTGYSIERDVPLLPSIAVDYTRPMPVSSCYPRYHI